MIDVNYMQCDDYRVWRIRGYFCTYVDNLVSARAMKNRLRRLFAMTPSIKEISTSSDAYNITCHKICPDLVEILKTLELMDVHLTHKEYEHAQNELYEPYPPHPSGRRFRHESIVLPWEE